MDLCRGLLSEWSFISSTVSTTTSSSSFFCATNEQWIYKYTNVNALPTCPDQSVDRLLNCYANQILSTQYTLIWLPKRTCWQPFLIWCKFENCSKHSVGLHSLKVSHLMMHQWFLQPWLCRTGQVTVCSFTSNDNCRFAQDKLGDQPPCRFLNNTNVSKKVGQEKNIKVMHKACGHPIILSNFKSHLSLGTCVLLWYSVNTECKKLKCSRWRYFTYACARKIKLTSNGAKKIIIQIEFTRGKSKLCGVKQNHWHQCEVDKRAGKILRSLGQGTLAMEVRIYSRTMRNVVTKAQLMLNAISAQWPPLCT